MTAFQGGPSGQPVVQRVAQVQVPTNRMADLYLVLAQVCEGQVTVTGAEGEPQSTCPSGESCQPSGPMVGQCGTNIIDGSTLPTYAPGQSLDAGLAAFAAGSDAGSAGDATSAADAAGSDSSPEAATCTNACTVGLTECSGGAVQTCETQPSGCTQWVTTTTCTANQTCTSASGMAACVCASSVCTQTGTVCTNGQTLATCMMDADDCLYVASSSPCSTNESCSGLAPNAVCSTQLGDSCAKGQAACVSGELASCTLGSNGYYAYGTPVPCPSSNQTCTGSAGSATCSCNIDALCTIAGGTCQSSSILSTCAADLQGCVYTASATECMNGVCSGSVGSASCCLNACSTGATQCSGEGSFQSCGLQSSGCTGWGAATGCPSTALVCTGSVCGNTLTLAYEAASTGDGVTTISFNVQVTNTTATAQNLSQVAIQYYFNADGASTFISQVNNASISTPNAPPYYTSITDDTSVTFAPLSPATATADTVLTISFSSLAGMLAAGGILEVQPVFEGPNYATNFTQSNDYSYDGSDTEESGYGPNQNITVQVSGFTVWGTAP